MKQSVTLERKLPAAVKLPGNSFNVKATAEAAAGNNCKALAADKLQSIVETDLVRYNNQLTPNPGAPDTVISIRMLNCSAVSTPEYGMLAQNDNVLIAQSRNVLLTRSGWGGGIRNT